MGQGINYLLRCCCARPTVGSKNRFARHPILARNIFRCRRNFCLLVGVFFLPQGFFFSLLGVFYESPYVQRFIFIMLQVTTHNSVVMAITASATAVLWLVRAV